MMWILFSILAYVIGFIFVVIAEIIPMFKYVYFHIFGWTIMFFPIIIFTYRLLTSDAIHFFNTINKNEVLIQFLRRDGTDQPLKGKRLHYGLSFIDVEKLGIIHDLGSVPPPGSVYKIGDKKTRFALENLNHTPNPAYAGFTHWMRHELGIRNINDLYDMIGGKNDALLIEVYHKLLDKKDKTQGEKIIENIASLEGDKK